MPDTSIDAGCVHPHQHFTVLDLGPNDVAKFKDIG